MIAPRWRKVSRDLLANKARTALVVMSIAIGVAAIGAIAGARVIILESLTKAYASVNQAHATITSETFGDEMVEAARGTPGVREAEGRRVVGARVQVGPDRWRNLDLFVVPDYRDIRINVVRPSAGAWPPPERGLLVERSSTKLIEAEVGDELLIEMPDGTRRRLPLAGTAHDLSQPGSTTSGRAYGYVTFETLGWLGEPHGYNRLLLQVRERADDRAHIQAVTNEVRDRLETSGRVVHQAVVPIPGQFWANDAVQSMLVLLSVLGAVCLSMSAFLVINTISALLQQQVRQIGVIKAIGGRSRQTAVMYLAMVVTYALLALVVGIPLGAYGAISLIAAGPATLNFDAVPFYIPVEVLALEVAAGLIVPLLAAVQPIAAGSRVTVREAISTFGLGSGFGEGAIDQMLARVGRLPRPILISLRNTFRRKGRLALTLATLALGGSIFVAVLSVRESLGLTADQLYKYNDFDVQIRFAQPYAAAQVERLALTIPGVERVEVWARRAAYRARPDRTESGFMGVTAPPAATDLMTAQLLAGRWLDQHDQNAVVVNSDVLREEPDVRLGGPLTLKIDGVEAEFTVVGVVRGVLLGPILYINKPYLERLAGIGGQASSIMLLAPVEDQAALGAAIERAYKDAGMQVVEVDMIGERKALLHANFQIIVSFLMTMAILIAVVGGIGLAGTMSMNVLERTREIGVLRAVGASNRVVMSIILVEGIVVGVLSWVLGAVLALPMSALLVDFVGQAFLRERIPLVIATGGALQWLAIVLALTALASLVPAWNAARLTVRDVLAYE
jgi:putative ABC transport system permease protein